MFRNVQCMARFGTLPMRQSALLGVPRSTFTAGLSCDRPAVEHTRRKGDMSSTLGVCNSRAGTDARQSATCYTGQRRRHHPVATQATCYTKTAMNCYWTEQRHDSVHTVMYVGMGLDLHKILSRQILQVKGYIAFRWVVICCHQLHY